MAAFGGNRQYHTGLIFVMVTFILNEKIWFCLMVFFVIVIIKVIKHLLGVMMSYSYCFLLYYCCVLLYYCMLCRINSQAGESRRVLTTEYGGDLKASILCQTLVMVQRRQQSMCVRMDSRKCSFIMLRWRMLYSVSMRNFYFTSLANCLTNRGCVKNFPVFFAMVTWNSI